MLEKVSDMVGKAKEMASEVRAFQDEIRVISHYDADGICSASIIVKALARGGKRFRLSFVKQLSEEVVKQLSEEGHRMFMFLDLGSGHLENIRKYLGSRTCLVLDHHQVQGDPSGVLHLNPLEFGIEENVSGSGVAYLFARSLDPENIELSELAIVGAIGDSQIGAVGANWGLLGLNKEILLDAQKSGKIGVERGLRLWGRTTRPIHKALEYSLDPYIPGITGSESASVQFLLDTGIDVKNGSSWRTLSELSEEEQKALASGIIRERIRGGEDNPDWVFGDVYTLMDKGRFNDANEFATILNATGKMDRTYIGVALCLNDPSASSKVRGLLEDYRRELSRGIRWLEAERDRVLVSKKEGNFVFAGNNISEHLISNIISTAHRSSMLPGDKPVFAFVDTDDGKVKISARASERLVESGMNLKEIMTRATEGMGGEGGGHAGAAGATIPKGMEEPFMENVLSIIGSSRMEEAAS